MKSFSPHSCDVLRVKRNLSWCLVVAGREAVEMRFISYEAFRYARKDSFNSMLLPWWNLELENARYAENNDSLDYWNENQPALVGGSWNARLVWESSTKK